MEIPILKTSHLTLRSLQTTDAEVLHCIYHVDGVLRYFPKQDPPPLEKLIKFVENQRKHWEDYGYGNWGIVPEGETEIIGWAGLQFLKETGETEVGYLLNRPYWGHGYATEAARAALAFAFGNFDHEKIIGLTHPENTASQQVLEKCGLTFSERKVYFGMEMCCYRIERPRFSEIVRGKNKGQPDAG